MSKPPKSRNLVGQIKLNTQISRTSPRPHEDRRLGRTTNITDSDGKIIKIDYQELDTIKFLGRGQYGVVSKMVHRPSQMILAAKRINLSNDSEGQRSELQDLDIPMRAGDCPYTVKFYGALFAEGFIWILSECMDSPLDKFYLKAKSLNLKLPEIILSNVAFSVLSALEYLKRKNIMHRDVKPSNILINRDCTIKLCDFGISGTMNNSRCQTRERGCRPYMAPEKIDPNSTGGYSVKSDIWSLGITLIEIATTRHPYIECGDYFSQIKAILNGPVPKLPNEEFSPEFCLFVEKCLIKNHEERGGLEELIKYEFIEKYLKENADTNFVGDLIEKIQADTDES